jgi:hypothetical protein
VDLEDACMTYALLIACVDARHVLLRLRKGLAASGCANAWACGCSYVHLTTLAM